MKDYTRVTEILKPFTGIEFIPDAYLIPAADRGTDVHECIEKKLSGFEVPANEEILPYLRSFDTFWEGSKHAFEDGKIVLEKRLFCDKFMITGQIDCIIEMTDRTYLLDWKTSKRLHKSSFMLQGAAYKYLCEVNNYPNVDDVLFVKLDLHGKKPTLFKEGNYEESLEMFFKCFDLFWFFDMKNTRKRKGYG